MGSGKKLSASWICCVLLISASLILIPMIQVAEASTWRYQNRELKSGYHHKYGITASNGDEVELSFILQQGNASDLYIMSWQQYSEYYARGENFTAVFSVENISSVEKEWVQPDDQDYYIVIDNKDNAHPDDAEPEGLIVYDLEYDDHWDDDFEEFFGLAFLGVGLCCLLIVVIIIGILYFATRGRKDDTVVIPANRYSPPRQSQYQYGPPPPGQYQTPGPQYPPHPPPQGHAYNREPPDQPEY